MFAFLIYHYFQRILGIWLYCFYWKHQQSNQSLTVATRLLPKQKFTGRKLARHGQNTVTDPMGAAGPIWAARNGNCVYMYIYIYALVLNRNYKFVDIYIYMYIYRYIYMYIYIYLHTCTIWLYDRLILYCLRVCLFRILTQYYQNISLSILYPHNVLLCYIYIVLLYNVLYWHFSYII